MQHQIRVLNMYDITLMHKQVYEPQAISNHKM